MTKTIFFYLCFFILLFSCKKQDTTPPQIELPSITTNAATNLTSTTALCGGNITNISGTTIISSGICWADTQNPKIINNHTIDTTIIGSFTNNITNLLPSTTYYIRAYIRTISDTLYGNQISITTPSMHLYVCGYELLSANYVAKLWKDGVSISLTDGTKDAKASSVIAVGNDVYVAGYESNGSKTVAKIWKNGIATNLTNGTNNSVAYSVVIVNNIVYAVGYESNGLHNIAKIWINGTASNLTNGNFDAEALSIAVTNNKIYVAGYEADGAQGGQAKSWTNGVATNLTNGSDNSGAYSIFVSGTDVYIAGYQAPSFSALYVTLWKNGREMVIDQGNFFFGYGTGVSVSGNEVHLVGRTNDSGAAWWKNGRATALTSSTNSRTYAVQAVGSTAYIAGSDYIFDPRNGTSHSVATYWTNNLATKLSTGLLPSFASSIFVQ